jgi:Na+-driven multidrug efflux pump
MKKTYLSIKFKDFKPSRKIYSEILKIGIPSALSMIIMSISMILVIVVASGYGDYVVAGCGVQMRIVSICMMLIMGLGLGYQPFAGFNYGSKKWNRLISGFKVTIIYSTILTVFFTILFAFSAKILMRLFVNDTPTVEAGVKMLRAFLWGMPVIGIQITMMVTFQATGKAVKALIVSLGRQCLIYIPLLFILNFMFGFKGFIFAQPAADIITTVLAVMLSISFLKEIYSKKHEMLNKEGKKGKIISAEETSIALEYSSSD